jgi:hypothetical protein
MMYFKFRAVRPLFSIFTIFAAVIASFSGRVFAKDVTWELQAERLQNVSAALLDNLPVGAPVSAQFSLGLGTQISFLPKPSPKIGGKSEKVPASPIHAVPTVTLSGLPFLNVGSWGRFVGVQTWAGFLPPGGEKLFGVNAKLTQYSLGFAVLGAVPITPTLYFYSPVGFQYNSVDVEGAITASNAKDSFIAKTNLYYIAPGFRYVPWKIWGNVLIGKKLTKSTFKIPADETNFEINDDLSDTPLPVFTQMTIGTDLPYNFSANFSYELMVERLAMPRIGLSYQYSFL